MADNLSDVQAFIYTKDMQYVGPVGAPAKLTATLVDNGMSAVTLELASDDPMVKDANAAGARLVIRLRGVGVFSGKKMEATGDLLAATSTSIAFDGDYRLLDSLALVAPGQPIEPTSLSGTGPDRLAQATYPNGAVVGADGTSSGQYGYTVFPDSVTSAEAAIKWLLQANLIDRLNLQNVRIEPDQGRGGDPSGIFPLLRFSTLAEGVQPFLDFGNLSLVILQQPGTNYISIDVRARDSWPAPLTVASGVVVGGTWSTTEPTVTRAIVGGPGEDAARAIFARVDSKGLEAKYGDVREVFRDATGANLKWPDTLAQAYQVAKYYLLRSEVSSGDKATFRAYINQQWNAVLADGAPTTSVTATLAETDGFHFGGAEGIQLGTQVGIKAADQVVYTDRITQAKVSYTATDGLEVTPIVGSKKDDPTQELASAVARLAASARRQAANR